MTIAELNRRLNSVKIGELAEESLRENKDYVLNANKDQLLDGERADGTRIVPKYVSKPYAKWKHKINNRAGEGTPDLRLTGIFYEKFFINILGQNRYIISSLDDKTKMLSDKYDYKIFGLNTDNAEEIGKRYVQPTFIKRLKNVLFK
jgi:hypothetical protein